MEDKEVLNNKIVSIIIPVYNAEKYIGETLDSVIAQDYPYKEIVIVDDCSTDGSFAIISRYIKKGYNVKYYRMEKNSGVALARNKAIEIASGRYIAFIDSDDVWEKEKLTVQLKLFEQYSNIPFTYTAISYIDENSRIIKGKINVKEKVTYSYLLKNTMLATSTVIIDRNVVNKVCMPNRKSAEDYSLWLSILKQYGPAYGINQAYTRYRKSKYSLSSNKIGEVKYFYDVQYKDMGLNRINVLINTLCYMLNAVKKHFL